VPMCFLAEKNATDLSRGLLLNKMGFLPSSKKVLRAFRWNDDLSLPHLLSHVSFRFIAWPLSTYRGSWCRPPAFGDEYSDPR